jgi:hypothetical protein
MNTLDGQIGRSRRREVGLGGGGVRRGRSHTVLPTGCRSAPTGLPSRMRQRQVILRLLCVHEHIGEVGLERQFLCLKEIK